MPLVSTGSGAAVAVVTNAVINHWLALRCNDIEKGTATAGAAASITDANARREESGYWDGAEVYIDAGTGAGQARLITTSTSAGVMNVAPNWTTNPDSTSQYSLRRKFKANQYQMFIDEAFHSLTRRRKFLIPKFDTSLTWVTDQFDYTVPTGFVLLKHVAVATVASPGTDDYEYTSDDRWYVLQNTTRKLQFNRAMGQFTNGYALRLEGYQEFTLPAAPTDQYNVDPDPIIAWAYVFALQSQANSDASNHLQNLIRAAIEEAERTEGKMAPIDISGCRRVEAM